MAKLVLFLADGSMQDIGLHKERITLGRRADNDVCLPHAPVSGEHAAVVTILSDSFLEDLGSTNGTLVNGKAIVKHFLRDGDVIDVGRQRLVYLVDENASADAATIADARAAWPAESGAINAGTATDPTQWDRPASTLAAADGRRGMNAAAPHPPLSRDAATPAGMSGVPEGHANGHSLLSRGARSVSSPDTPAIESHAHPIDAASHPTAIDAPSRPMASNPTWHPTTIEPASHLTGAEPASQTSGLDMTAPSHAMPTTWQSELVQAASLVREMHGALPPHSHAPEPAGASNLPPPPAAIDTSSARTVDTSLPAAAVPHLDVGPITRPELLVLTGPSAGRTLALTKEVHSVGRVGTQVALIRRGTRGFMIVPAAGSRAPLLNGTVVSAGGFDLEPGDVIEVAGARIEFITGDAARTSR